MSRRSRDWKREAKARRARRAKPFALSAVSSHLREGLADAAQWIKRNRWGEARRTLEQLDREHPNHPDVLRSLLDVYHAQRSWGPYCVTAKRLVELQPDNRDALLMLAGGCLARSLPSAALVTFRRCRERWRGTPLSEGIEQTTAGLEAQVPKLLAEMGLVGQQGLELGALHDEVMLWLEEGYWARAVRAGERFLAVQPNFVPVLNNVSAAYFQLGDHAGAIRTAQRVLAAQPDNVQALGNLVRFLMLSGRIDEARSQARALRPLPVRHPRDWAKKAEAEALVGDDDAVLEALRDSEPVREDMEPDNRGLLYHLGAVSHLRQGREAEARQCWRLARQAAPELDLVVENLEDLAKPIGDRHGPWPFAFSHWLRREAMDALIQTASPKGKPGSAKSTRAQCLAKYPELTQLVPELLDRGDPAGRKYALLVAEELDTPELREALRQFAASQRGPDQERSRVALKLHRQGALPTNVTRMWVKGAWKDVRHTGIDIYTEPVDCHGELAGELATDAYEALQDGDGEEAETLLREALQIEPNAPDLWNNLAAALSLQGRDEESSRLVDEVHRRFPDYLFARTALALRYARAGDLERAEQMLAPLQDLPRMHLTEFAAYCQAQALLMGARQQWDAADTWLKMWRDVDPDNPQLIATEHHLLTGHLGALQALSARRRKPRR